MTRAGLILIQNQNIALIERHGFKEHYFILPGGQVDEGESLQQALIREAMEELGITVEPQKLVAVVTFNHKPQYYYQVRVVGGIFGSGCGPEMMGLYPPEHGTYFPMWMPRNRIRLSNIRPTPLIPILEAACLGIWPQQPLYLDEANHD